MKNAPPHSSAPGEAKRSKGAAREARWLPPIAPPPPAPEALRQRVLAAVRDRPPPRRPDRLTGGLVRGVLALAAMMGVLYLFGGPEHGAGRSAAFGAGVLAGFIALAAGATWLALPSRRSMLAPPRWRLLAVALGVPVLTGAWLLVWHATYEDPFTRLALRCFVMTTLTAPGPFLVLTYVGRRLDPRSPALTGAALGATAGAWAAVMVELWCPLAMPDHVLAGHVLPLAALTVAGAVYGARRLRLRRVK
jgi:hypothetical protein